MSAPQRLPITIRRNLKVVASDADPVTVQETSIERVGKTTPATVLQRYVTERSPAYSINLPFNTGDGPYAVWKNETGTV